MFRYYSIVFILFLACKSHQPAYKLIHKNEYDYSIPVHLTDQIIRLHSFKNDPRVASCELTFATKNYVVRSSLDKYGNQIWIIHLDGTTPDFKFSTALSLDTNRLLLTNYRYSLSEYNGSADEFLDVEEFDAPMNEFVKANPIKQNADEEELQLACNNVYAEFGYNERYEAGVYSTSELIKEGSGACRDLTWFLVQYLRGQKIRARVVSGYLIDWVEKTVGFHAWAEAKTNEGKWVGLDPTNGEFVTASHVPLAIGKDFKEIYALEGMTDSCSVSMSGDLKIIKQ